MKRIKQLLCRTLGLTPEQFAAIAEHKAADNLAYRAMAILIGSVAFGVGVFSFARALLQYELLPAMAFGLVCGSVLYLIERNNIIEILATGRLTTKVLWTRVGVNGVMLMCAVVLAAFPLGEDIDALQADTARSKAIQLAADPRHAAQFVAAQAATEQAAEDVTRERTLQAELNDLNQAHAAAMANQRLECDGSIGVDGARRALGCGPKAKGFATEAERIDKARNAIGLELSALAGSGQRLLAAQSSLGTMNTRIQAEAERLNGGAAGRLGDLWTLVWSKGSALFTVAFYLVLSLLPEVMVITALSKPGVYAPMFNRLNAQEDHKAHQELDLLWERTRDAYADVMPVRHLMAPSATKRSTRPAAENEAKLNGADASAADERAAA